jgi:hypothetical protein
MARPDPSLLEGVVAPEVLDAMKVASAALKLQVLALRPDRRLLAPYSAVDAARPRPHFWNEVVEGQPRLKQLAPR